MQVQNEGMNVQRLHLPAALVLCAMTLTAWIHLVNGTRSGVSVVNHSGSILRNVEVCLTSGECAVRPALWPHDAWQVPLPNDADVAQVRYRDAGMVIRKVGQSRILVQKNGQIRVAE